MKRYYVLLLLAALIAGCITVPGQTYEEAQIVEVVDGDTVVTADGETVRLLDVNTPEKGYAYANAARERLEQLVLNETVQLEQGYEDRDQYGRLLRYVHLNGLLVNQVLVEEGLATTYFYADVGNHRDDLRAAEDTARTAGHGIWTRSAAADCITVTAFQYDPEGNDNYRLNEEYITFQNTCSTTLNLDGWTVKDAGTNTYTFNKLLLEPGSTVTLHTGRGTNDGSNRYWGRGTTVWNNDGDTLYFRDTVELLAAYEEY